MRDDYQFTDGFTRYAIDPHGPPGIDPQRASRVVRQFLAREQLQHSSLATWLRRQRLTTSSDAALIAELVREIETGWIRVRELSHTSSTVYTHRIPDLPDITPAAPPPPAELPLDDDRSLFITRCDPELGDAPLSFTYLFRGLAGRPATLRISAATFPGQTVHERALAPAETADGSHDAEWDGIVTVPGEHQQQRLPASYSPARVELIHDDTYRDAAPFTIRRPIHLVHVVETEDVVFATDREILMPDGGVDHELDDHARATGLHAIAAVLRYAAFHPDEHLGVFGHTDTVGSDADNLTLSTERATNVRHVLVGDAQAWAAHCDQHFEVADVQRILRWVARTKGWVTDPGPIDNDFGSLTRSARVAFREQMNAEYGTALEQGARQGVADWLAYFTLYDETLVELLGGDAAELERIRGELTFTSPATVGCGEAFPAEQPELNNFASATNRRVDIVFFAPDELPELPGDPPGHPLYGTKDYRAEYIPLDGGARHLVRLQLLDGDEDLAGVDWIIERAGEILAEGTTTAGGLVEAELPTDQSGLVLKLPTLALAFALEVAALEPIATLEGLQARLANLGYPCTPTGARDEATRDALIAFQHDHELEATGEADDDTLTALRSAHGS